MLRKTVALLIVLNLIWWIWAKDWLAWAGLSSAPASSPEFLARQIHPEALRVQPLPPGTPIIKTVPAPPEPLVASQAAPGTVSASTPALAPEVGTDKKHQNHRR